MRRYQITRHVFGPTLVRAFIVRQHRRDVGGFQHAHTAGPDFVITVTPRFHEKEKRDDERIDDDNEMWRIFVAKSK